MRPRCLTSRPGTSSTETTGSNERKAGSNASLSCLGVPLHRNITRQIPVPTRKAIHPADSKIDGVKVANENPSGSTSEVFATSRLMSHCVVIGLSWRWRGTQGCRVASNTEVLSTSRFSSQGQVTWHFLLASLVLGAVRLTFEAFPVGAHVGRLLIRAQPSLLHLAFKDAVGSCGSSGSPFTLWSLRSSVLRFSFELPLLWFSKERPSAVLSPFASGPCPHLCEETDNRHLTAKSNTPSVHVVLPDCDGLLRKWLCRFVAPYCQPWGSSRFQHSLPPTTFL